MNYTTSRNFADCLFPYGARALTTCRKEKWTIYFTIPQTLYFVTLNGSFHIACLTSLSNNTVFASHLKFQDKHKSGMNKRLHNTTNRWHDKSRRRKKGREDLSPLTIRQKWHIWLVVFNVEKSAHTYWTQGYILYWAH